MRRNGRLWVGTSGYVYPSWRGVFYPRGLGTQAWLAHYARCFSTVEVNATFYRLPKACTVARWSDSTPSAFRFAVKGSRFLTHQKRLTDVGRGLERFYAPLRALGPKLAVVLWQLPPQMTKADPERLDRFLGHQPQGLRLAVEFRHPAWYVEEVCAVLAAHGAAFCEHDRLLLAPPRLTANFRYLRFHGPLGARVRGYGRRRLVPAGRSLRAWAQCGHDAYAYFNNDLNGHAVRDAQRLSALLDRANEAPSPGGRLASGEPLGTGAGSGPSNARYEGRGASLATPQGV